MELVDVHYNLELECEYGHPVEIETYFCHKCSQYHQEQNIDYSKNSFEVLEAFTPKKKDGENH